MKQKILLTALLMILILSYFLSCQKAINENVISPIDSTGTTDTMPTLHCDTTIIGADTCIKCNDSCVQCADICTDTTRPFVLYMNPKGSDKNSGLTEDSALKTLNGVQTKLIQYKPILHQDVEIRIKYIDILPYAKDVVEWTYTSPIHTISFMPSDYKYGNGIEDISGRPTFNGEGTIPYWFKLSTTKQAKTNIRFYYIKIQGYVNGAINLHGSTTTSNTNNTIYGCYFYELGSTQCEKYNVSCPGDHDIGFGAIDLVNSDYNTIQENHFVHCENLDPDGSHMHGVYLATNSDHNLVEKNNFSYISGDPVRVRDYSNYNKILSNDFKRCGVYSYFSGYRKYDRIHNRVECLSYQNEFSHNTVSCAYNGNNIPLVSFWYSDKEQKREYESSGFPRCDSPSLGAWYHRTDNDDIKNKDCD